MDLFTWICFFVLLVMCCLLVHYYSAPSVSFYVKITSVLTWVLNFGLALLVPEDLYYTLTHFGQHHDLEWTVAQVSDPKFREISNTYLTLYWVVYILTWTIIPVLQEWENSGDLKSTDRLKRSLKSNGVFYLYMLIGGVLFLILLIWINAAGDMGIMTFLKCMASAFGMFLLMILMGYGMVEIPRSHWRTGNLTHEVQYLHHRISEAQQEQQSAQDELEQVACHIYRLRDGPQGQDPTIMQYVDICLSMMPQLTKIKIAKRYKQVFTEENLTEYPHDIETAIEMHRWIKRVLTRLHRANEQHEVYIRKAIFAEDVLEASTNQSQILRSPLLKNPSRFSWQWYCRIKPILKRCLAVLLTIFTIILLISQSQVFLSTKESILSYFLKIKNLKVLRFLSLAILSLISYLAYYSLFRLKLSNIYGLYKRSSDGPSLMFATINFSRIGAALVINFFDMIKVRGIFIYVMGGSKLGLLGDWVIKGMPGTLWIIVLMHYFNGWSKLMKWVGLDDWGFNKWDGTDTVVSVLKQKRRQYEAGIDL